ncbi:MAG: sulfatase [Planctomycetota bacterium]
MSQPNILMITCHDLGRHLGCYGVESVQTPNIDRLAARGVRFENFYSTSAVCSPARGSLHTGRYPQSNGLMGLTHGPWWWRLNEGERHTASLLRDGGYATHLIGFNHVSPDPASLGYEHIPDTRCDPRKAVHAAGDLFARAGGDGRPFFAKVGFTEVHRPFRHGQDTAKGVYVPPWLQDTEQVRDDLAAFQATIKFFDERVGEILDALAASDVADETLVVFTSDHGMPYPGAKWTVRKAGIEVPLICHQPGTVFDGGRTVGELMSNVDVLPTLLDYVGCDVPDGVQGVSFMDLLAGRTTEPPRREAFAQYTPDMKRDNTSRCVVTDRYHLIRYFDAGRTVAYPVDVHPQTFAAHQQRCPTSGTRPFYQLFDLRDDPHELTDIAADEANAGLVAELSASLLGWMRRVDDPLLSGPVPTPYYQRAIADLNRAADETRA